MLRRWICLGFVLAGCGNIFAQVKSGIDYQKAQNWYQNPGLLNTSVKENRSKTSSDSSTVDIFYIHSTTHISGFKKNGQMHKPAIKRKVNILAMNQLAAFQGLGEFYIPAYRQAKLKYTLYGKLHKRTAALEFAYQDVSSAFTHFIEHRDSTKPIIVVAHGQGSLHAQRLLYSITDSKVLKNIVVAYLAGYPFQEIDNVKDLSLPYCGDSMQTGCIVSWQTFGKYANFKGKNLPLFWDGSEYTTEIVGVLQCTNPLTWKRNQDTLIDLKIEALRPTNSLKMVSRTFEWFATATVKDARLMIYGEPRLLFNSTGDNHHMYDYNLFYSEIRKNAQQRIYQWKESNSK